jgi:drug/metabolite transporter (DMT)-like permease
LTPMPAARKQVVLATSALLGVTAIWGSTFVVVKDAVEKMPVLDFLAWRFGIATIALALIKPRAVLHLGRRGLLAGLALGLALGAGYVTQTFGLEHTPASVSGFITGMFVVFTPLVAGLVLRRRVGAQAWAAVALATVGLALISLHGASLGRGEALTLLCALSFAVHIVGLGEWSPSYDAFGLAVVQLGVVTVLCTIAAAPDSLAPPPDWHVWRAVLLTGLAASALAFLIQKWAQGYLPPVRTAVVLTMEPVFAGIFGVLVDDDPLSVRIFLGAACVLTAMLFVEAGPRHGAEGQVERLEA